MRVLRSLLYLTLVTGLLACGGTNKKEYPYFELVKPSIRVQTHWVAKLGELSEFQYTQLPTTVIDHKVYIANSAGGIGLVDAMSGKVTWIARLHEKLTAGPAVAGDVLVVSNDEAEVILLDIKSGQVKWRTPVAGIVLSNPLILKGKVVVQTVSGNVVALNIDSGKQIWQESRDVPPLSIRGTSKLVAAGHNRIVTGFANGKIAALDVVTGKTQWESVLAAPRGRSDLERVVDIDGAFYIKDDILFATAYRGRVAAIALDSGQIIWMRDMSSHTGVVSDGRSLFMSDADGNVWALDIKTGATLWRQDKLAGRDVSAPAVTSQFVVVGDGSGLLHWLAKEDGKLSAQQDLNQVYRDAFVLVDDEQLEIRDTAVTAMPVVIDEKVFVRDNAGALSVFSVSPRS